ncbi:GNAT family N-acetyltransferase [Clostridium sp. MSJ-4]|uniref:GNAT family N-acetyltransferase n=1 Tax=Clostridium simiarum TaxID=2841506 RepID=A0ABS6EYW7_9CLOT|nr:GNAT family N-acetyltransferase [Clostridium simiarum]MBU5591406.1 GNAT family N-acetyltransferase [Clostridium simiarum]
MGSTGIRDAQDSDSSIMAELIYSTENEPEQIWGGKSKEENLNIIKDLIRNHNSRYSSSYSKIAEHNGEVVGVLVTIPYNELEYSNIKTDLAILKNLRGFKRKVGFLLNELKFSVIKECNKGDLYIANIAVDNKARGLGIGKILMEEAELLAKENNYSRCTLLAKDEYVAKFYRKINYRLVYDRNIFGNRIIKMAKVL